MIAPTASARVLFAIFHSDPRSNADTQANWRKVISFPTNHEAMPSKYALLASLLLLTTGLRSQTIAITFEGSMNGASTPLDSILVMNLTQGGDTTIYFPGNVLLLDGTTGIANTEHLGMAMQALPNPFTGRTEVTLNATEGELLLTLHDALGRQVAGYAANVAAGVHRFEVNCEGPGMHLLTAVQDATRRTVRLMATEGSGVVKLKHLGGSERLMPKSDRSLFTWTAGDELRYIGYATAANIIHSAAIDEVPVASATRTFVLAAGVACPDAPSVTDIDGNVYASVKIGGQCWMAANLKTTRYRDGTTLPHITDNTAWSQLNNGAWSNYDNSPANDDAYGKLYNWYAAANPNICPQGWHMPTDAEWTTLTGFLGGSTVAGGKMKTVSPLWNAPNTGATNASGFSGLPTGFRDDLDGSFVNLGGFGIWWCATESGPDQAWSRGLYDTTTTVYRATNSERLGFGLRCVRD